MQVINFTNLVIFFNLQMFCFKVVTEKNKPKGLNFSSLI